MRSQDRLGSLRKARIEKACAAGRAFSRFDVLDFTLSLIEPPALIEIVSDNGRANIQREQKKMLVEAIGE
jgi:hypothetical protein